MKLIAEAVVIATMPIVSYWCAVLFTEGNPLIDVEVERKWRWILGVLVTVTAILLVALFIWGEILNS